MTVAQLIQGKVSPYSAVCMVKQKDTETVSSFNRYSIEDIEKIVCKHFGTQPERLHLKVRFREIVMYRQITMYLAKKQTKHSFKYIGRYFGGFDHTTVMHACQTVQNLMDSDPEYKRDVDFIIQKLITI